MEGENNCNKGKCAQYTQRMIVNGVAFTYDVKERKLNGKNNIFTQNLNKDAK